MTTDELTCVNEGCSRIRDESDDQGRCAFHRQKERNAAGVCPNCGGAMAQHAVMNALTGKQLRDGNSGELRWTWRCVGCGYEQRRESRRGRVVRGGTRDRQPR